MRKPLAAAILDDGTRLAVLSTDHKVNVYDLSQSRLKLLRTVALDNPPHTITLSPKGEVLAAAYDGGVEVYSLAAHALETDWRAVKCDRVDSLAFSNDGTTLLGTTETSKNPNTVILSAPYFTDADHDVPHNEMVSHMWTSQILFPNSSRDCSHAALLPRQPEVESSWTLTYDRVFESFRAVRTEDLRNGTTYFTGPKSQQESRQRKAAKTPLTPSTLPTITRRGDLVAVGFLGNEIWLYGVPEGLDMPGGVSTDETVQGGSTTGPNTSHISAVSVEGTLHASIMELGRLPPWQVLVDKHRNVFAKGRRVARVLGATNMCWVSHSPGLKVSADFRERLVVAAPGGVSGFSEIGEEELASVDGGRLVILDFEVNTRNGLEKEVTIEVGTVEPEMLEEENVDMATEIAIVRRRTVSRRDNAPRASVVDALRPVRGVDDIPDVPAIPQSVSVGFGLDSTADDAVADNEPITPESPIEGLSLEQTVEALDDPYSHTNPRSRNTLYRSATAVQANRLRNPTPRIPSSGRVEYRRTDGTELPHESDADNWVPPPPPYTLDADRPFPEHLRKAFMARVNPSSSSGASPAPQPRRSHTTREGSFRENASRRRSSAENNGTQSIMQRQVSSRPNDSSAVPPVPPPSVSSPSVTSPSVPNRPVSLGDEVVGPLNPQPLAEPLFHDGLPPRGVSSPTRLTQRPTTSYESRSSALRDRNSPELLRPVSPVRESLTTDFHDCGRSSSFVPSPLTATFPPSQELTLSGSNLQQRLAYPLPPRPSTETPNIDSRDWSTRRQFSELATATVPSVSTGDRRSLTLTSPTAYQLSQLQNRSFSSPSPVSASTPGLQSYVGIAQRFPVRGPPRGALGALRQSPPRGDHPSSSSRFRSPFRNSTVAPARALSRSSSRESTSRLSTYSYSVSTPNLRRPQAHRLDTIYSIASRVSHTRTRSRDPETRPESRMYGLRRGSEVPGSDDNDVAARERTIWGGRGRRRQSLRMDGTNRDEWEVRADEGVGGRKRARKCVVM